jgi:hypothetical protein
LEYFISSSTTARAKHRITCPFRLEPVILCPEKLAQQRIRLKHEADENARLWTTARGLGEKEAVNSLKRKHPSTRTAACPGAPSNKNTEQKTDVQKKQNNHSIKLDESSEDSEGHAEDDEENECTEEDDPRAASYAEHYQHKKQKIGASTAAVVRLQQRETNNVSSFCENAGAAPAFVCSSAAVISSPFSPECLSPSAVRVNEVEGDTRKHHNAGKRGDSKQKMQCPEQESAATSNNLSFSNFDKLYSSPPVVGTIQFSMLTPPSKQALDPSMHLLLQHQQSQVRGNLSTYFTTPSTAISLSFPSHDPWSSTTSNVEVSSNPNTTTTIVEEQCKVLEVTASDLTPYGCSRKHETPVNFQPFVEYTPLPSLNHSVVIPQQDSPECVNSQNDAASLSQPLVFHNEENHLPFLKGGRTLVTSAAMLEPPELYRLTSPPNSTAVLDAAEKISPTSLHVHWSAVEPATNQQSASSLLSHVNSHFSNATQLPTHSFVPLELPPLLTPTPLLFPLQPLQLNHHDCPAELPTLLTPMPLVFPLKPLQLNHPACPNGEQDAVVTSYQQSYQQSQRDVFQFNQLQLSIIEESMRILQRQQQQLASISLGSNNWRRSQ